jgi:hypothetical protein
MEKEHRVESKKTSGLITKIDTNRCKFPLRSLALLAALLARGAAYRKKKTVRCGFESLRACLGISGMKGIGVEEFPL